MQSALSLQYPLIIMELNINKIYKFNYILVKHNTLHLPSFDDTTHKHKFLKNGTDSIEVYANRSLIILQKTHKLIWCLSDERRLTFKFLLIQFLFFYLFFFYILYVTAAFSYLRPFSLFYCHHENCYLCVVFRCDCLRFFHSWYIGHMSVSYYDKKRKRNPVVLSSWNLARGKTKINGISGTKI